ncbi:hypothetical protein V6N12_013970 [Hibiscus sabdariffa]|uniref:Uncharacterized protein n=1 Tax=Hibiscus sabdariffa TaxID=183260 RepID=A0ABR1ZNB2_9ROSI
MSRVSPVVSIVSNALPLVDGATHVCMQDSHDGSVPEVDAQYLPSQTSSSTPIQVVGRSADGTSVQTERAPPEPGLPEIPEESLARSLSREMYLGGDVGCASPMQEVASNASTTGSVGHMIAAPVSNEEIPGNLEVVNTDEASIPQPQGK